MVEELPSDKKPVAFAQAGSALLVLTEILFVAMLGSYLSTSIFSASFFGHLALGRWILSSASFPREELWMNVGYGMPWTYSAWLFGAAAALLEEFCGPKGLLWAKVLTFILFVGVLCFSFSKRCGDRFVGACFASLVSCGVLFAAPFEPKLFSLILLVLIVELSYRNKCLGLSYRRAFCVFLLGVVFSNISPVGLILSGISVSVLLFCAGETQDSKSEKTNYRRSVVFVGLLFLGVFVSPYFGSAVAGELREIMNLLSLELVYRLNPATIFSYPTAFLILLTLLFSVFLHYSPKSLRPGELLLISLVVLLALGTESLLPLALIGVGFGCALIWGRNEGMGFGNLGESLLRCKAFLGKTPAKGGLWVVLCLTIVSLSRVSATAYTVYFLPSHEMDFIVEQDLSFPLLHESAVGPYVQYRLSDRSGVPSKHGAIAPRTVGILPEVAYSETRLAALEPGWKEFFNYVAPRTVLVRSGAPLFEVLRRDSSWKLVFQNGSVVESGSTRKAAPESWAIFVGGE